MSISFSGRASVKVAMSAKINEKSRSRLKVSVTKNTERKHARLPANVFSLKKGKCGPPINLPATLESPSPKDRAYIPMLRDKVSFTKREVRSIPETKVRGPLEIFPSSRSLEAVFVMKLMSGIFIPFMRKISLIIYKSAAAIRA